MKKIFAALLVLTLVVVVARPWQEASTTNEPACVVQQDGTLVAPITVSANNLVEETYLYASLSALPDEEPATAEIEEETDSGGISGLSLETIASVILLIITTVLGSFWRKALTKMKSAVDLLSTTVYALDDGNLSASEIAEIKLKYNELIGDTNSE